MERKDEIYGRESRQKSLNKHTCRFKVYTMSCTRYEWSMYLVYGLVVNVKTK